MTRLEVIRALLSGQTVRRAHKGYVTYMGRRHMYEVTLRGLTSTVTCNMNAYGDESVRLTWRGLLSYIRTNYQRGVRVPQKATKPMTPAQIKAHLKELTYAPQEETVAFVHTHLQEVAALIGHSESELASAVDAYDRQSLAFAVLQSIKKREKTLKAEKVATTSQICEQLASKISTTDLQLNTLYELARHCDEIHFSDGRTTIVVWASRLRAIKALKRTDLTVRLTQRALEIRWPTGGLNLRSFGRKGQFRIARVTVPALAQAA